MRALGSQSFFKEEGGEAALQDVAQLSWMLVCDFYLSPECIKHTPQRIAAAVLVLAVAMLGLPLGHGWWDPFWPYAAEEELLAIARPLLDLLTGEGGGITAAMSARA